MRHRETFYVLGDYGQECFCACGVSQIFWLVLSPIDNDKAQKRGEGQRLHSPATDSRLVH